ncbi:tyrosine-type recombinase/integrase [Ralstonia pseudosolanacearum]|uniref:tyrosine-type recombinase/integrase n=1 Tax=Ralstonia pseudosolanacearum TaxID=1310165 RepID=UPI000DAB89DA|nr:site-specific integrase [Ralstonia pseudosolanacearum]RAA14841.1 site-specific integrase [Ralstonia pseudosolanacearum]
MGTIFERTDNAGAATFQAKIRRKGFPPVSKTFPTRDEAERWMLEAETELLSRITAATQACPPPPMPLESEAQALETPELRLVMADLLKRYATEETPNKKGADVEAARLRAMTKLPLAMIPVSELAQRDLREWRDTRLKKVSASTVNRDLNLLNAVFKLAVQEWDIAIPKNVFNGIRRPKNTPPRDRRLSAKEEVALFAAIADTRGGYLRQIVELALETGMRQSELVALEWERISLPRRTIRLLEGTTKNGHGRAVPLSRRAVEVLESLAPEDKRHGRVFPDLTTEAVKRAFIRTRERACIQDFHFHDLRHEATSRLFEKGLNAAEVASVIGHKDTRMLMRYTHLDASKLADKVDRKLD